MLLDTLKFVQNYANSYTQTHTHTLTWQGRYHYLERNGIIPSLLLKTSSIIVIQKYCAKIYKIGTVGDNKICHFNHLKCGIFQWH